MRVSGNRDASYTVDTKFLAILIFTCKMKVDTKRYGSIRSSIRIIREHIDNKLDILQKIGD